MRINISSLAGNATVLAGTEQGRRVLTQLVDTVREPESAAPMFFDFSGVTVATASFLREGPLEYRRLIRSRSSKLYPIVANASDEILEELGLFLESQNDAIFACTLSDAGA